MKARKSLNNKLNILLLFVAALIFATWFVQAAAIDPWQRWEDNLLLLLGMRLMDYKLLKTGIFFVILLVFLFQGIHRRKLKKMKIPKI